MGPRTLDLDIMLFGNRIINTERLIVPHYGLKEREFMLYPLSEIAPSCFPDGEKLSERLTQVLEMANVLGYSSLKCSTSYEVWSQEIISGGYYNETNFSG